MDLNRYYEKEDFPIESLLGNIKKDIVNKLIEASCKSVEFWLEISTEEIDLGYSQDLDYSDVFHIGKCMSYKVALSMKESCRLSIDYNGLTEVNDYSIVPKFLNVGDMEFELPEEYQNEIVEMLKAKVNE